MDYAEGRPAIFRLTTALRRDIIDAQPRPREELSPRFGTKVLGFRWSAMQIFDAAIKETLLCMSGDRILMDYSSALGPIDPQVFNGKDWVPALGYLDKVEQLLAKARNDTLSNAEFLILQAQDLALLSRYEQARDLTITLLKKWLVEYKFKSWKSHRSDPRKRGKRVTQAEKVERATEIARVLGDDKQWHSHGRMIGPQTLSSALRLEVDDYSEDQELRAKIRAYDDLLTDYIARSGFATFFHSRNYF